MITRAHFYTTHVCQKWFVLCAALLNIALASSAQLHCVEQRYSDLPLFDSAQVVVESNLVYASAPSVTTGVLQDLQLDVWHADPQVDALTARPVILLVHGGGFAAGNRSAMNYACMEYARRGFVAVTISYRLGWNCDPNSGILLCGLCGSQSTTFRKAIYAAVQDVRAAVRFVAHHASEWNADPEMIFVGGESAGAISALLAATWDQDEANSFVPGAAPQLNELDSSGNTLAIQPALRGVVNHCGAVILSSDIDAEDALPVIHFHDELDCVVPYAGGHLLGCFGCTSFAYAQGSSLIHDRLQNLGVCSEMNTVSGSLNHCSWPALFVVKRASCFMKRVMCDVCTTIENNGIYATSPCSSLGHSAEESGCTYPEAINYQPSALVDDGSCLFSPAACPSDINADGWINVNDLLIFISDYGLNCD